LGTTSWQPGVFVPGPKAGSAAFAESYRARFGREPVPLSMHGYAAARVMFAAMAAVARDGRSPAGETLRDALASVDVETPLGRIKFDTSGDPLYYQRVIVQVQHGRHMVVYPPDVATGRLMPPPR
jgi:branched-chain amino acid transport system substrate-binding protein